jgi:8-oxo-dGTP pyrophosphatase MutT (NUDIX family)
MTQIAAGLIDVYVIDPSRHPWRALLLQRAQGTRSPGSWEAVHGKIDPGETPEQAALREIKEETGLEIQRLYNVMVQPFYLHHANTVQLAIVFCAFADSNHTVTRSDEHQAHTWLSIGEAVNCYTWPRAIQAIRSIEKLLANNSAGPAEDVMRIV